ncbi:hypothetical protein C8R47DRAFT_250978 [Mycena vitilis]|nr:hypothetical protein C8R47DRAFT_250978 [Mycena vitilis]
MSFIPQELIDAIVGEVDEFDLESLRACSLVGQAFRYPSQRILLRSITVKFWDSWPSKSPSAVIALFEESAHIVPYITRLTISLRFPTLEFEGLEHIFSLLVNVRRCAISSFGQEIAFTRTMAGPFLPFLARQPLRELHLAKLSDFPVADFLRMAPSISFTAVTPSLAMADAPAEASPVIRDLVLHPGSDALVAFFSTPPVRPSVSALSRRLSVVPDKSHANPLVTLAARCLEHVHFNCITTLESPMQLHPLPLLHLLEFRVSFLKHDYHLVLNPIVDTITYILTSNTSPTLAKITLHFPSWKDRLKLPLLPMTAMDEALTAHPSVHLRWRMNFNVDERERRQTRFPGADYLVSRYTLQNSVRQALPLAHARRRLLVEEYRETPDEWSIRGAD